MSEELEIKMIDRRTSERYMRAGLLDEKAYEKYIKSLPDVADKSTRVESSMSDDESDDNSES